MRKKKKLNGFQLRQQRLAKQQHQKNQEFRNRIQKTQDRRIFIENEINGSNKIRRNGGGKIEPLPYISYLANLPEEIQTQVSNYITENPVFERGCWYNATNLNLVIPEIDTIHGYYFTMNFEKNKREWESMKLETRTFIDNCLRPLMNKDNIAVVSRKNRFFDMFNKIFNWDRAIFSKDSSIPIWFCERNGSWNVLDRHTWNRYNNVHFDITNPFYKNYENYDWIYYFDLGINGDLEVSPDTFPILQNFIQETTGSMNNINYHSNNNYLQSTFN